MKLLLTLVAMLLWLPPALANPPPNASETPAPLIDVTQRDLYRAINFDSTNTDPVAIRERFDEIERLAAEARQSVPQPFRFIKTFLTSRANRALYDWFLDKIRLVPESHQGTAAEHIALFRDFIGRHLPRAFERHVTPTTFELRRELVSYLTGTAETYPYRLKEMFDDTKRSPTAEAVHAEFQSTFNLRWPIRIAACTFLMIGSVFAWNLWQNANHQVDQRIQQAAPEVPLRHPVPAQPAAPRMEDDPLFQAGRELGRELEQGLPPVRPPAPNPAP